MGGLILSHLRDSDPEKTHAPAPNGQGMMKQKAPVAPYCAFGDAVREWRQQRLMKRGSADEHTYVPSSEAGHVEQAYVQAPVEPAQNSATGMRIKQTYVHAPVAHYRVFGDAVREWRQQRLMKRASADDIYVSSSEAVECAKKRRLAACEARRILSAATTPVLCPTPSTVCQGTSNVADPLETCRVIPENLTRRDPAFPTRFDIPGLSL